MTEAIARKILVLGASGLIGRFVTDDLRAQGFHVVGVARRLSASQKNSALDLELPVMSMDAAVLARLLRDRGIDVVVNCLGVLQDGPGSDTAAVHCDFVARLLQAIRDSGRTIRLVHISIPGTPETDRTAFSSTKREAERLIAESGVAFAILRPGFVVAPAAYGGSAMVLFWVVSGFIALVISYDAAAEILRSHGFPPSLVAPVTILTSLMDMSIGVLIAFRRSSAFGLIAGIVASLGYMIGAAILTPDLWIDPLGALVKTGPAVVLMVVALLTLDNR